MKNCPACNLTFPDFHEVCHFDGTTLVPAKERALIIRPVTGRSRLQRAFKSPVLWAGLLLIPVVASVFLGAYYDAINRSTPLVTSPPRAAGVDAVAPTIPSAVAVTPIPAANPVRRTHRRELARRALPPSSTASRGRTVAVGTGSGLIVRRGPSDRRLSEAVPVPAAAKRKPDAARPSADQKDLVAMVKSTWRVLKRPFRW